MNSDEHKIPVNELNLRKPSLRVESTTIQQHFLDKKVNLQEDDFAIYYDDTGAQHVIKRFTWKNKNRIEIQAINYGARILAIKLPDRQGGIEDILLGFDDLAGYLFYDELYFGAVIGRTSNTIKNSLLNVGKKKFNLSSNMNGTHHTNGGFRGLDKTVWSTYVDGSKVVMSCVSPHLTEGYPGDLLVRVSMELSPKNEFSVNFEAETTQPTCVDISHLLYFNLAGHHSGPNEIYRHMLTMNCNCFTPEMDGFPTGEIFNVLYSDFDFQVPKLLGKCIGLIPNDGFNQNLCVNRGADQTNCFVGRLYHPPTGRMLEIYSNQPGVQLNTANHFGYGLTRYFSDIHQKMSEKSMEMLRKIHESADILKADDNFEEILQLIDKVKSSPLEHLTISPNHLEYLQKANEMLCNEEIVNKQCLDVKKTLEELLNIAKAPSKASRQSYRQSVTPKLKPTNKIPVYYKDTHQIRGKGRAIYKTHGALAMQTQNYPNAVNIKPFPNAILNPGEKYHHQICYKFWIRGGNPSKWISRNMKK